nr:DUF892 family protein [Sinorhizobium americanum]
MGTTDHLHAWLRDAHAMEEQAITMLTSQSERLENYPELKAQIDKHLRETRDQVAMLDRCLQRTGGGASRVKDITGKIVAFAVRFERIVRHPQSTIARRTAGSLQLSIPTAAGTISSLPGRGMFLVGRRNVACGAAIHRGDEQRLHSGSIPGEASTTPKCVTNHEIRCGISSIAIPIGNLFPVSPLRQVRFKPAVLFAGTKLDSLRLVPSQMADIHKEAVF